MSSAAKLRKYGRGTATVAAAALVMTSFGPAAFASWDDAPQTPNIDGLQTTGTIGIVDTQAGILTGDQVPDVLSGDRSPVAPDDTTVTGLTATSGIDANPAGPETADENQGATLVYAGENGQRIADVRLVLPNRFASGDILDLRLLDRSATEHSDGLANRSADTLVGFSGSEGVTVEVSQAMDARTRVNDDTDQIDAASGATSPTMANPRTSGNTETSPLVWTAGTPTAANPQRGTAPSAAPSFSAPQVSQTNTQQGKDNLRLSVQNASTGDPDAVWVVTVKGLKVDLGKNATPGELRLVPFLSNAVPAGNGYTASPWFYGNAKEDNNGTPSLLTDDTPREIGIYTVPAFVSPVTISSTKNDIVADGLAQSIGDIKIAETQAFSLQNGTYTVDFSNSGANVTIESAASAIKAAIANGGAAETVSNVSVSQDKKSFSFTLAGADNTKISTITLSGLTLKATTSGSIEFNITGGSISGSADSWLASPAGTSTLAYTNPTGASVYPAAALLAWNAAANAPGTAPESRTVSAPASFAVTTAPAAPASSAVTATAGNDRLPAGTYTTTNGGVTYVGDGTPAVTLTRTAAGATTYTAAVPGAGAATDTYTITGNPASFVVAAPAVANLFEDLTTDGAVTTSPATPGPQGLPVGTYTASNTGGTPGAGDTLTNGSFVLTYTDADGVGPGTTFVWRSNAATPIDYTLTGYTSSGNLVVEAGVDVVPTPQPALTLTAGEDAATGSGTSAALPAGTYTANSAATSISGGGVTLTRPNTATNTWTVQSSSAANVFAGDEYIITGVTPDLAFVTDGTTGGITGIVGGYVTATSGTSNLLPGNYSVAVAASGAANGFDITLPNTQTVTDILNGEAFDANGTAAGTGTVTLTGLAAGQTFTVSAAAIASATVLDFGVNQKDILAPLDEYTQLGTASAESARIGGNNRYETAAKIAEKWAFGDKSNTHGKVRNAIIASGENFPDALSASYLSQRMGAPVLLTQRGSIPQDTIEALRDRQVDKVFIVGGPAAVSRSVQDQLANLNTYRWSSSGSDYDDQGGLETTGSKLSVQRLSSANPQNDTRYTTNQLVNMYAAAWGGQRTIGKTVYKAGEAGKYTAIFARGDNFPDALAAGVLTAGIKDSSVLPINYSNDNALPLVLTQPGELNNSARALIENLDVQHALIIGSENAISDGVKSSIEDMGLTNTRLGGEDRYFTAAAVDEFAMRSADPAVTGNEYPGLGFIGNPDASGVYGDDATSYLANGLKFPDALTAAPWIGRYANVLNLTEGATKLSGGTTDFLNKRAADIDRAIALGLGDAVSTGVLNEANKIASSK